jgi:hypothetical protein
MIGVVAYNGDHFLRCCIQCRKVSKFQSCVFFCIVAYNADNFYVLWTTARKNDWLCCLHSGNFISVVVLSVCVCVCVSYKKNIVALIVKACNVTFFYLGQTT